MARIPGGEQFGQVVARPQQAVGADPNAYGAGIGQAIERAGNIGMQMQIDQTQQANAEAKRLQREQEAEAKAAAREAQRVKALTAQATVENSLADLHDQIGNELDTGVLDKAKAPEEWQKRSTKAVNDALQMVDPENRELVNATLLGKIGQFRASINKQVVARDRKDILAGGLGYFEQMERHAARGGKFADEAISNVRTFWGATAASAGEDAATASKRVQMFAENVRARQAADMVNKDPAGALKALKNQSFLPELDPDRRSALVQTADAAVLRNQQRAEINARAAERKQEKAWDAARTVFEAGKMPTPEYAAQLARQFSGTPYAGALKAMMQDGPRNSAFVAQPVPLQAQALTALQNKMNTGGATPEEVKEFNRLKGLADKTAADVKENPYVAASERGVLTTLTPLTLDLQSLPQQLARRAQESNVVSQWVGREVSLFQPAEAAKVGEVLQALPAKDRASALSTLSKAMTAGQMREFAVQLGAKNEALASAALMASRGRATSSGRLTAEIVLAGADALKEQRVKMPAGMSETSVRAEIDKELRGVFSSENAQRAARDTAFAIFAGLVADGSDPSVKQAVKLATGGIAEFNGARVVKPYGWSDDKFTATATSPDTISRSSGGNPVLIAGQKVDPATLAAQMKNATLGPGTRSGAYTVNIGGRPVLTEDGRPFQIDMEGR